MKASVYKDSNKIISSSGVDWSNVKEGSLIGFGDERIFYQINAKKKNFLVKSFSVKDEASIEVENLNGEIFTGDIVKLSFKQYKVAGLELVDSEESFQVGDKIEIDIPDNFPDVKTGLDNNCTIVINSTKSGQIDDFDIIEGGLFFNQNEIQCFTKNGRAKFDVYFEEIGERLIKEYEVWGTKNNNIIILNGILPENAQSGKLSVEKWEATLATNYASYSKVGVPVRLTSDFTPHYNLPLMQSISLAQGQIFNEAMKRIELKIKELESKIR